MEKSKKFTVIYVISSILLFISLLIGGTYGIYLSVGINFMRSTVAPINEMTDFNEFNDGGPSNVSYGGTVNFQSSMIGVIILSVVLIVLSIAYLISLFKQLVFFKQFKLIRESGLEHSIEKKVKSKSSVVFMTGLINVLSILVGAVGIFVNATSNFVGGQIWVLYVVDGLVIIFSLISFIMLIKKVKSKKKVRDEVNANDEKENNEQNQNKKRKSIEKQIINFDFNDEIDGVDKIEYILIKLKNMKQSNIISDEEYDYFKEKFTGFSKKKKTIKKTYRKIAK